jgi:hypothetical protein
MEGQGILKDILKLCKDFLDLATDDKHRTYFILVWAVALGLFANFLDIDNFKNGVWREFPDHSINNHFMTLTYLASERNSIFTVLEKTAPVNVHSWEIDTLSNGSLNFKTGVLGGMLRMPSAIIWIWHNLVSIIIGFVILFFIISRYYIATNKELKNLHLIGISAISIIHGIYIMTLGGLFTSPFGVIAITVFFMIIANDMIKYKIRKDFIPAFLPSIIYFILIFGCHAAAGFWIKSSYIYEQAVLMYFNEHSFLCITWYHLMIIVSLILGSWNVFLRADDIIGKEQ